MCGVQRCCRACRRRRRLGRRLCLAVGRGVFFDGHVQFRGVPQTRICRRDVTGTPIGERCAPRAQQMQLSGAADKAVSSKKSAEDVCSQWIDVTAKYSKLSKSSRDRSSSRVARRYLWRARLGYGRRLPISLWRFPALGLSAKRNSTSAAGPSRKEDALPDGQHCVRLTPRRGQY
jgi:hypothetical protein